VEAVDSREGGHLLSIVQLKRLDQFILVVWNVPTIQHQWSLSIIK